MEENIVYVVQFDTWSYFPDNDEEFKQSEVIGVAQSIEDAARLIVAESRKHRNDYDYGQMWDEYLVTKAKIDTPPMQGLEVIRPSEYKDYLEIISCESEFLESGAKTLYMIGKESPAYHLYLEVAKEMGYDINK